MAKEVVEAVDPTDESWNQFAGKITCSYKNCDRPCQYRFVGVKDGFFVMVSIRNKDDVIRSNKMFLLM